jgi:hypothetical protein
LAELDRAAEPSDGLPGVLGFRDLLIAGSKPGMTMENYLGLVRLALNPCGLSGIGWVLIPNKSNFFSIFSNPINPCVLGITEQALIGNGNDFRGKKNYLSLFLQTFTGDFFFHLCSLQGIYPYKDFVPIRKYNI